MMKTKLVNKIGSGSLFACALVSLVAAMALGTPAAARPRSESDPPATPTLVGVWQVMRHGINCNTGQELVSFPVLTTFNGDGTLHIDALGTPIHGVWQREPGQGNYSFREVSYNFDPDTGDLQSITVGTVSVHMTSPTTCTGTATVQDFDPNGNLIRTRCGRSEWTRFQ